MLTSEAELCEFKCVSDACNVRDTLIRDQLIVGTHSETIRQDALKNQWQLDDLIKNGRITESGVIAASEIKTETKYDVNRTRTPMNKRIRLLQLRLCVILYCKLSFKCRIEPGYSTTLDCAQYHKRRVSVMDKKTLKVSKKRRRTLRDIRKGWVDQNLEAEGLTYSVGKF